MCGIFSILFDRDIESHSGDCELVLCMTSQKVPQETHTCAEEWVQAGQVQELYRMI